MFLFGWGAPSPLEMFVFALIILLLFGNRLPSVMRSLGRGVVEFKKGVQGIEDDLDGAFKKDSQQTKKEDQAAPKDDQAAPKDDQAAVK